MDDFSKLSHISKYTLYQLSINSDKYYRTYSITKKSGKLRTISQPSKKLKGLQSWILIHILNQLRVSSSCKGFERGTSIADNASSHRGANSLLTIDLEDFFPSITQKQIFQVFKALGYNNTIAVALSNICTYNETLPQGSPCSPKLANLVAWKLDIRIQGFVGKRGITYTRYADDLSFSGLHPLKVVQVIPMIKKIIKDEDFKVNKDKTRIAGSSRAKIVTGLVIAGEEFGIGKKKYKNVRSKIFHLTLPTEQHNLTLLEEVRGWLAYLKSVDKKRFTKAKKYINDLSLNHPSTLVTKLMMR